jgi:hypothetical protein
MRSASFAERLDAHVVSQSRHASARSAVATAAWFGPAIPWFPGAARFRAPGSGPATSPVSVPRPWRRLTGAEREALDLLASASAVPLDPSFDAPLLRRAFRSAARKLHPDAHPTACSAERERLGTAFAAARAAYLILLPLSEERPRG